MKFVEKVQNFIDENGLLEPGDSVIVGLSGGADSVALLLALKELSEYYGISLNAVHVNHGIRGEEADRDEEFCAEFCQKQGIPFQTFKIDVPALAKESGSSEEETGRKERYRIFEEVAENKPCSSKIAVAHHKDDQVETILFHMIRGAGIKGLVGMLPQNKKVIRPLLGVSRKEIEGYLSEKGQAFCTDRTNLDTEYDRNRIRNNVLPELRKINQKAEEHILSLAEDAKLVMNRIYLEADAAEKKAVFREDEGICISIDVLRAMSDDAFAEVMLRFMEKICGKRKDIARVHISELKGLLGKKSGSKIDLPYKMEARREYDKLIICKGKFEERCQEPVQIDRTAIEAGKKVCCEFGGRHFSFEVSAFSGTDAIPASETVKMFDFDKVIGNIYFRYPVKDDKICIRMENENGNVGYKRFSRLMIDRKVPQEKRKSTILFTDDEECIWVVGHRISEIYKVSSDTKKILKVTIEDCRDRELQG